MKTKLIILLSLVIVGSLYFGINGNPLAKAKSREIVEDYMNENYPDQSFTISNVGYYPGEAVYIVHVVSKDFGIEGNINVKKGKVVGEEF
ncbi:YfjL-like protein [Litchfieldia alkalitelluris]|uniref:YfjL-like protein n=1 Tax=Litchfieldia alkalitelluris TaxID=304268 RepID=UPI000998161E|nr:hypothetical protein [Litchfieldia alkalitelluris]